MKIINFGSQHQRPKNLLNVIFQELLPNFRENFDKVSEIIKFTEFPFSTIFRKYLIDNLLDILKYFWNIFCSDDFTKSKNICFKLHYLLIFQNS